LYLPPDYYKSPQGLRLDGYNQLKLDPSEKEWLTHITVLPKILDMAKNSCKGQTLQLIWPLMLLNYFSTLQRIKALIIATLLATFINETLHTHTHTHTYVLFTVISKVKVHLVFCECK
jgi:hypothetical protein